MATPEWEVHIRYIKETVDKIESAVCDKGGLFDRVREVEKNQVSQKSYMAMYASLGGIIGGVITLIIKRFW
jgi:hypothetical protein